VEKSKMLKRMRELKSLGFAVLWLKEKSKAPVESGWTKRVPDTADALAEKYKPGLNMGVRLGAASKIGKKYLAVIDCDVKSTETHHLAEMSSKLQALFGATIHQAPTVWSGRGNGSMHVYILTDAPVAPKRLAQSTEKVRVKMPSVQPSKFERSALSEKELKEGWRLRAAWEISLMGEGQQVVLPGSIHPDTGAAYELKGNLRRIPVVVPPNKGEVLPRAESGPVAPFKEVPVELEFTDLSPETIEMIVNGEGVEDRSASIFIACCNMVRAGLSDDEIKTVLTDRNNFLGEAAFDHAKTDSRARAAEWLDRYTLQKARRELDAQKQFEAEVAVSELSAEELQKQHHEILQEGDWRNLLERTSPQSGEKVKATAGNVKLILECAVSPALVLRNKFTDRDVYGCATPWGGRKGYELRNIDLIKIKMWLSKHYRFEPNTNLVEEVVQYIAEENAFHPVREYLAKLKWDGVKRADYWCEKYLGATGPKEYVHAVSRKVLVALVARVLEPGVKFDHVLILQGKQGTGKSTTLRNLVGGGEFFSELQADIGDKDIVQQMKGKWLLEIGELSRLNGAELEHVKEFVVRQEDRVRMPYDKRTEAHPRQCVFIGTTNQEEFLKDDTGNRRFWPLSVSRCDFEGVKEVQAQLLAEAMVLYAEGEALYLDDEKTREQSEQQQKERMVSDVWEDQVFDYLHGEKKKPKKDQVIDPNCFSISDLIGPFSPLKIGDDMPSQFRLGRVLKKLGYIKKDTWLGGKNKKMWYAPPEKGLVAPEA
jgi:predicted P-loop ATPase